MSSNKQHPDSPVVVLGMHADDTLNVFVRDADQQLHQAARITTRNGVDPMAMTTIMADLTEAFGWRQIVSAAPVGVPQTSGELARGNRAVAVAAAVTAREPKEAPKPPAPKAKPKTTRRTPEQMQRQTEAILTLLDGVDRLHPIGIPEIVTHVMGEFGLGPNIDPNVRDHVNRLHEAGRVGLVVDPTETSGGKPRKRWYGIRPTASATPVFWGEAAASVALDGDTQS